MVSEDFSVISDACYKLYFLNISVFWGSQNSYFWREIDLRLFELHSLTSYLSITNITYKDKHIVCDYSIQKSNIIISGYLYRIADTIGYNPYSRCLKPSSLVMLIVRTQPSCSVTYTWLYSHRQSPSAFHSWRAKVVSLF